MPEGYRVYLMDLSAISIINCLDVPEDYRIRKDSRNHFYEKLKNSIAQEGMRNPILVNAGMVPGLYNRYLTPEQINDPKDVLACVNLGGSRLWAAQQLDIVIPCIVSDFVSRFANHGYREITETQEIIDIHLDKPRWAMFSPLGVKVSQLEHYHLGPF